MLQSSQNIWYLSPDKHVDSEQGLGWIAAAITAVAALVPFLVKVLKRDDWSRMDRADKEQFVKEGIIVAKQAVKTGQAKSIEEFMQQLIAQIEKNENWSTWKHRNPWAVDIIEEAETQIQTIKLQEAGLLPSGILTWVMVLSALGFAWYKREWIKSKTGLIKG